VLDTITIHHTGNGGTDNMKDIQHDHIHGDQEMADIGYHFGIDSEGRIYEGRDIGVKGSHAKDANSGNIGIVLLGDMHEDGFDINGNDEVTPEMEESLLGLVEYLKDAYPKIRTLGGHNEIVPNHTDCPGSLTEEKINSWRYITSLDQPVVS
jgi:N-acetyl-anhydromuramyl-L-alanine amidase AmpD